MMIKEVRALPSSSSTVAAWPSNSDLEAWSNALNTSVEVVSARSRAATQEPLSSAARTAPWAFTQAVKFRVDSSAALPAFRFASAVAMRLTAMSSAALALPRAISPKAS